MDKVVVQGARAGAASIVALFAAGALLGGCASTRVPPTDFDPTRAAIVRSAADPAVTLGGPSGKAGGAGRGAAIGAGSGIAVGAVGCLAAGPFYPLCLLAVVPTATAVGAVSGATVGAVRSESAEALATKRAMLTGELAAGAHQARLAEVVRNRMLERYAIDLPLLDPAVMPSDGTASADPAATA